MVAPISIENAEFRLRRVASLFIEVTHDLCEIVCVHSKALLFTEGGVLIRSHRAEARKVFDSSDVCLFALPYNREVLLTGFYRIDIVRCYTGQGLVRGVRREDQQTRALDANVRLGVYEVDAILGRRGALVELTGQILYREMLAVQRIGIRNQIGHFLAEDRITALLQEFRSKAEKVVHFYEPQRTELQGEILIEIAEQALGLDSETIPLLHKNSFGTFHSKNLPTAAHALGGHRG